MRPDFSVPVTDLAAYFKRMRARGYRLGVASSDNERSIRQTAQRFGFLDCLDYIAGYDSGFGTKPEPGMVLGFLPAPVFTRNKSLSSATTITTCIWASNAGAGLTVAVLTGTGSRESLAARRTTASTISPGLRACCPLLQPV